MDEIEELRQRLVVIEKGYRFMSFILGIVVTILIAIGVYSSVARPVADVVRARDLEIVGRDGKSLVSLKYDAWYEGGVVTVFDQNGARRGWVGGSPAGGIAMVVSQNGLSAKLAATKREASMVLLQSAPDSMVIAEVRNDLSHVSLFDKNGKQKIVTVPSARK